MLRAGGTKRVAMVGGRPERSESSAIGTLVMLALLAVVAFAATYSVMSALHGSSASVDVGLPADNLQGDELGQGEKGRGLPEEVTEAGTLRGGSEGSTAGGAAGEAAALEPQNTCRGLRNFELWGDVVVWGNDNRVPRAEDCCAQCKLKCQSEDCSCNSWVYCADKELCKENYRQCWLKKQEDVLKPDVHGLAADVPWTSGIIHAPGKGIIALATDLGNVRIKLEPSWAPMTVNYIRDLLQAKYCTGCQLYRAEGLGEGWNTDGSRTDKAPGPPYALVQGTLQTDGLPFKPIPREASPVVKRGFVCLVGEGPDFFISLADHTEWGNAHTVFGRVPEEDLAGVLQQVLGLPTKQETWGETKVLALSTAVNFKIVRDDSGIVL